MDRMDRVGTREQICQVRTACTVVAAAAQMTNTARIQESQFGIHSCAALGGSSKVDLCSE